MLNPGVSRSSSNNYKPSPLSPYFESINRSTENPLTSHPSEKPDSYDKIMRIKVCINCI